MEVIFSAFIEQLNKLDAYDLQYCTIWVAQLKLHDTITMLIMDTLLNYYTDLNGFAKKLKSTIRVVRNKSRNAIASVSSAAESHFAISF